MKRIKKYTKPKQEKPTPPKTRTVSLPSRFQLGIFNLFDSPSNLEEVEADLQSGPDGSLSFFHERHLKKLYDKYRNGEIDIRYIRKWFALFIMVSTEIGLLKGKPYCETIIELMKLAKNNQLTRKNFLELNRQLFLRVDKASERFYLDIRTGKVVEVTYDQSARVLPLLPKRKGKREGKKPK